MKKIFDVNSRGLPKRWGLEIDTDGALIHGGCRLVDLAQGFGTPLHVVNERRLAVTARRFLHAVDDLYPEKTSVHFAFKCNPVPGVIEIIKRAGLKAEVASEYELKLALKLGFTGADIVVNGPYKPISFLRLCLTCNVRFIVVDALYELETLNALCEAERCEVDVLLRINPDVVPRGMNQGSATGSRKSCAFGLDLKGGEVVEALQRLKRLSSVHFHGYHFHIGTGIYRPDDYRRALEQLKQLVEHTQNEGFAIRVFDVGGGLAATTSREMTARELLMYQGWERLPSQVPYRPDLTFGDFARAVAGGLQTVFSPGTLPELIVEPGRSIASSSQVLLLTVHQVKERSGLRKWLITDGGISNVTMPTYYEYHEVFLCDDARRPRSETVTITGPACFAADIVYRNKYMPVVEPGMVLAIMDSGAYCTSCESSFGFPRPAIVAVKDGRIREIRSRETFEQMTERDVL
jgi:diaminopimelate decarboxylase